MRYENINCTTISFKFRLVCAVGWIRMSLCNISTHPTPAFVPTGYFHDLEIDELLQVDPVMIQVQWLSSAYFVIGFVNEFGSVMNPLDDELALILLTTFGFRGAHYRLSTPHLPDDFSFNQPLSLKRRPPKIPHCLNDSCHRTLAIYSISPEA